MVLWRILGAVVDRLPPMLVRYLPGRYGIRPGLHGAVRRARRLHLPSLLGLILLLVAMVLLQDARTLAHLKNGVANHYLALVPPHPNGLATKQMWPVVQQVLSSALLTQNITHNGTFKGVASLRQFRLTEGQMHSFFPTCDASRLDKQPLEPAASRVPSAWRYSSVRQVGWVTGKRCSYPPEGYNVYLGDLQNHSVALNKTTMRLKAGLGTLPNEVLKEALWILKDLQQYEWVDGRTVALLLTLLAPQPGTATPTAITIIFENTRHFGGEDGGKPARWWASHSLVAVDLRPNTLSSVLLAVFIAAHLLITWLETNVSFNMMQTDPGEAARRCLSLATALHVVILALHAGVLYLHFTSRVEAHRELSRYYVSFDMRFDPREYIKGRSLRLLLRNLTSVISDGVDGDDGQVEGPSVERASEYMTQVRRITLARILELDNMSRTLLGVEVMLYLAVFVLFPQHHTEVIHTTMRTLRGGLKRSLVLVVPLLALFTLIFYFIHSAEHTEEEGGDFHSFATALKETLNTVLGPGEGAEIPWTVEEWLTGATLMLTGVVVTLLLWRVCLSSDESRARRTQRLPLHPLWHTSTLKRPLHP